SSAAGGRALRTRVRFFALSPDQFRARSLAPDTDIDLHQESCEPAPYVPESHCRGELHRLGPQQVPASSVLAPLAPASVWMRAPRSYKGPDPSRRDMRACVAPACRIGAHAIARLRARGLLQVREQTGPDKLPQASSVRKPWLWDRGRKYL